MRVYNAERNYTGHGCVASLGTFDGVHIAHQKLIGTAVALARREGVQSVVVTFTENPASVLFPARAPQPLTSLDEKIKRIEKLGVDAMIARPFTRAFASIGAAEYLETLVKYLSPMAIAVGYNYTFGRGGAGDADFLKKMESAFHYRTIVVPPVLLDGESVSSTVIRALLSAGEDEKARRMLGDLP
jgi:riboflavin kinase/FMN adenylyltransferase